MSIPLARVYRGAEVESLHTGSIVVVDSNGRLLAHAGDPSRRVCIRSAAKPFQAIPLLEYGGVEEFELSAEEIALTCASHGGEPFHVATTGAMLRKGDFDESDLLCGAHVPYDEKAAADLRASGEEPSPLHNNCSGKHAGMLLATRVMDVPNARYADAGHPLQALMSSTLSDFAGNGYDEITTAIDGCGVPAYYLSLYRAAYAYARLMNTARTSAAGVLDRYAESAGVVVDSMTGCPSYVAGAWSITTPLMEAFEGELLAKEGAEGFYAMALSPGLSRSAVHMDIEDDRSVGIALKIDDGSMTRGRNPVILRTLALLGLEAMERPQLQRYREWPLRNFTGTLVGEVRAEFELYML